MVNKILLSDDNELNEIVERFRIGYSSKLIKLIHQKRIFMFYKRKYFIENFVNSFKIYHKRIY